MQMTKIVTLLAVFVLCLAVSRPGKAETVCLSCHDRSAFANNVVHKPVAREQCSACHSPHAARYQGLLQKPVAELCFSCHQKEAVSFLEGVVHEPVRLGRCLACHEPHSSKAKGLLNGRLADSCFLCHDSIAKQYKVAHQPFANGQCFSCHLPHNANNYQLLRDDPDKVCLSCHERQSMDRAHVNYPAAVRGCLSCHNPHGSSRKAMIRDHMHEPYKDGCADCHTGNAVVSTAICLGCHEEIGVLAQTTHTHLTAGNGNSCTNCHSPHAGDKPGLLKARQVLVCRVCHEDTFRMYGGKPYGHKKAAYNCVQCHAVHGSSMAPMLQGDGNTICTKCHETQGVFTHPVGEGINDQRNNQSVTCVTCHNPHGTDFEFSLKYGGDDLCNQCHKGYMGLENK